MKTILPNIFLVGVGGFLGAVCRYGLSAFVQRHIHQPVFPLGTLLVNLIGCLAIGLLVGLDDSRQLLGGALRRFLLIGMLGGFTTFSTFGFEAFALLRDGEQTRALLHVSAHVVVGLVAVWLGYALASSS